MHPADKRDSGNAEHRRDFGMIVGALGIAGVTIAVFAYVLGLAPGDILTIASQVGVLR